MIPTKKLVLGSGILCAVSSVGTFITSFFIKDSNDPNEQEKQKKLKSNLKTCSLILLIISISICSFYYYYWVRNIELAEKLLHSLQTGDPDAVSTCDLYISRSKDKQTHEQFKAFQENVRRNKKLSPEEADYQVKNFCKTTAKADLGKK